jgi:hypothetical protein
VNGMRCCVASPACPVAGSATPTPSPAAPGRSWSGSSAPATPNLVLLVTAKHGSVDDPAVTAEGAALTQELAGEPAVQQASSYWTLGSAAPLCSDDGRQALVLARVAGNGDQVDQAVQQLLPATPAAGRGRCRSGAPRCPP